MIAALAVHTAGATLVPVNTRFTGAEALDVIGRSRASALFVAGPFLGADRLLALQDADHAQPGQLDGLRLIVTIPVEAGAASRSADWPRATVLTWAELARHAASVSARVAARRAGAVSPDDVSDILFTSGTTGRSKGAMSSHRQALAVAAAWAECGEVSPADRYLVLNPFFHSFGYGAASWSAC